MPRSFALGAHCGLVGFAAPIVENELGTFLGVVFSGQLRPDESDKEAEQRLETLFRKDGRPQLKRRDLSNLRKAFRKGFKGIAVGQ